MKQVTMMELENRYGKDETGKKVIADIVRGAGLSSLQRSPVGLEWLARSTCVALNSCLCASL